jgi:hypothetical protein
MRFIGTLACLTAVMGRAATAVMGMQSSWATVAQIYGAAGGQVQAPSMPLHHALA